MSEREPTTTDHPPAAPAEGALVDRVQADLRAARLARDGVAVRALRSLHAALQNAEAPPIEHGGAVRVAGTSPDVSRRALAVAHEQAVVRSEVVERTEAAATYRRHGQHDAADRLDAEVVVLMTYREATDWGIGPMLGSGRPDPHDGNG